MPGLSVDTNDRPVYKFGDAKRKQALSMVNVEVQPGGPRGTLTCALRPGNGRLLVLLSAKSLTALGAVINFETGQPIFR